MKKIIARILLMIIMVISLIQVLNKEQSEAITLDNLQEPIFRVNTDKKEVALTFDINWAEKDYIYEILDVLDEYKIKSTFFVMGKWIIYPEGNKEKFIEIYKRGHEIGNHSYIHPDFCNISYDRAIEEIKKTDEVIYENIGVKTNLFRYPSGSYNEKCKKSIADSEHFSIQWDVDSIDWREDGADIEYKRVIEKIKPGSIALFHNNAKYTPQNLEKLIISLQKEGYKFVKVGELIYQKNYCIDKNGEQSKKK